MNENKLVEKYLVNEMARAVVNTGKVTATAAKMILTTLKNPPGIISLRLRGVKWSVITDVGGKTYRILTPKGDTKVFKSAHDTVSFIIKLITGAKLDLMQSARSIAKHGEIFF